MADLLISPISTIYFGLLIRSCDCNITTSVLHLGRLDYCHDENYSIYTIHLPNSAYILANLMHVCIPLCHLSDVANS